MQQRLAQGRADCRKASPYLRDQLHGLVALNFINIEHPGVIQNAELANFIAFIDHRVHFAIDRFQPELFFHR